MKHPWPKIKRKLSSTYSQYSIKRNGFWFIDIPRTSSSSIRSELGTKFGMTYGKKNVIEKEYYTKQILTDHITAEKMRDILGEATWEKIFTFTIIRNPWDRVYSMYNYRKKVKNIPETTNFKDYVHCLEQAIIGDGVEPLDIDFKYHGFRYGVAEFIMGENGDVLVDHIVRYENREHDLKKIATQLNFPELGKRFIQKATPSNKHYSAVYDLETKEIVQKLYKKDIEMFDYKFDERT